MDNTVHNYLKKVLLVSKGILALSFFTPSILADPLNYDNQTVDKVAFDYKDISNSTWVNANITSSFTYATINSCDFTSASIGYFTYFIGSEISNTTFKEAEFIELLLTNATLNNVSYIGAVIQSNTSNYFKQATFNNVDFRDSENVRGDFAISTSTLAEAASVKNVMLSSGEVYNISLNSSDDTLSITGETYLRFSNATITKVSNAFLNGEIASISNGGTLSLHSGGVLELKNSSQLTLGATGNLNIELQSNSLASLIINDGSSLTLESGASINLSLGELNLSDLDMTTLISWENDDDIAALLPRLQDGTAFLIDGEKLAELGLVGVVDYTSKTYSLAYIPEPSTATLSLIALTGLLARRRRKTA